MLSWAGSFGETEPDGMEEARRDVRTSKYHNLNESETKHENAGRARSPDHISSRGFELNNAFHVSLEGRPGITRFGFR
jgi:hypothetical protein